MIVNKSPRVFHLESRLLDCKNVMILINLLPLTYFFLGGGTISFSSQANPHASFLTLLTFSQLKALKWLYSKRLLLSQWEMYKNIIAEAQVALILRSSWKWWLLCLSLICLTHYPFSCLTVNSAASESLSFQALTRFWSNLGFLA